MKKGILKKSSPLRAVHNDIQEEPPEDNNQTCGPNISQPEKALDPELGATSKCAYDTDQSEFSLQSESGSDSTFSLERDVCEKERPLERLKSPCPRETGEMGEDKEDDFLRMKTETTSNQKRKDTKRSDKKLESMPNTDHEEATKASTTSTSDTPKSKSSRFKKTNLRAADSMRITNDRLGVSPRTKFLKKRKSGDPSSPRVTRSAKDKASFTFTDIEAKQHVMTPETNSGTDCHVPASENEAATKHAERLSHVPMSGKDTIEDGESLPHMPISGKGTLGERECLPPVEMPGKDTVQGESLSHVPISGKDTLGEKEKLPFMEMPGKDPLQGESLPHVPISGKDTNGERESLPLVEMPGKDTLQGDGLSRVPIPGKETVHDGESFPRVPIPGKDTVGDRESLYYTPTSTDTASGSKTEKDIHIDSNIIDDVLMQTMDKEESEHIPDVPEPEINIQSHALDHEHNKLCASVEVIPSVKREPLCLVQQCIMVIESGISHHGSGTRSTDHEQSFKEMDGALIKGDQDDIDLSNILKDVLSNFKDISDDDIPSSISVKSGHNVDQSHLHSCDASESVSCDKGNVLPEAKQETSSTVIENYDLNESDSEIIASKYGAGVFMAEKNAVKNMSITDEQFTESNVQKGVSPAPICVEDATSCSSILEGCVGTNSDRQFSGNEKADSAAYDVSVSVRETCKVKDVDENIEEQEISDKVLDSSDVPRNALTNIDAVTMVTSGATENESLDKSNTNERHNNDWLFDSDEEETLV